MVRSKVIDRTKVLVLGRKNLMVRLWWVLV